jgi:hypothetical protein
MRVKNLQSLQRLSKKDEFEQIKKEYSSRCKRNRTAAALVCEKKLNEERGKKNLLLYRRR